MEEQNKQHKVINRFFVNNKAIKIILVIIIIGGALLLLANLKSPVLSQNLLSYWWSHSVTQQCKIVKQEFKETIQNEYDQSCLEQKNITLTEKYECWSKNSPTCDDCLINKTPISTPMYDTYKGVQIRNYYLGVIPVLEQWCPEGYSAE